MSCKNNQNTNKHCFIHFPLAIANNKLLRHCKGLIYLIFLSSKEGEVGLFRFCPMANTI